ncbi:hypothetical protein HMPREF3198_01028 [Winkia neuii]|nr:hypothetical protein HMPREF3198_01028 [Winkia neuii]
MWTHFAGAANFQPKNLRSYRCRLERTHRPRHRRRGRDPVHFQNRERNHGQALKRTQGANIECKIAL